MTKPRISLVATVLNEEGSIGSLLDSVVAQTLQPDEVVLVDGESTDRTVELAKSYADRLPLRILVKPGVNISEGRNLAIEAAAGEIIACTDGGVQLAPGWLDAITEPLREPTPKAEVVAGFFVADPKSRFETAMGATVLPHVDEIDPARFLPSSRSIAFRKSAWEVVDGYPEWLDYCEDLIFDLALRRAGYRFAWAPAAVAFFRPWSSYQSFFRQYYRYARGDGKSGLFFRRHLIRYGSYGLGSGLLLLGRRQPLAWLLLALGGLVYCRRPFIRLRRMTAGWSRRDRVIAALQVPAIRAVGDLAKMTGYPMGLLWRLRRPKNVLQCRARDNRMKQHRG